MKEPVLKKEISLKEAVENSMKELDRQKTLILAAQQMGHISTEELMSVYGDQFTANVLDAFRGAIVGKTNSSKNNQKGKDLEEYCCKLLLSEDFRKVEPKVDISIVEKSAPSISEKVDVAIFTAPNPEEGQANILDMLRSLKEKNRCLSLVCGFEENTGMTQLKAEVENLLRRDSTDIFFSLEKGLLHKQIKQNIVYGLVVGKVFGSPLKLMNGHFSDDCRKVVSSLSPPNVRVALFHMSDKIKVPIIHEYKTEKAVYFVVKKNEAILNDMLKKVEEKPIEVTEVEEVSIAEECEEIESGGGSVEDTVQDPEDVEGETNISASSKESQNG